MTTTTPTTDFYSLDIPFVSKFDRKRGRKPKYSTPEEALEAKNKATREHHRIHHLEYRDERNRKRSEKYALDKLNQIVIS